MKIIMEETTRVEVEVDPDAFINEFRQEADDFFENPARFADAKAQEEFISESIHIMGIDDFLMDEPPWIVGKIDRDYDLSVDVQ